MNATTKKERPASAGNEKTSAGERHPSMFTCVLMLVGVAAWLLTGFTYAEAAVAAGSGVDSGSEKTLRARHAALKGELANNAFRRPLVLESHQRLNDVKGDVYAVIAYPFAKVRLALTAPQAWCEILILHLNTKFCKIAGEGERTVLHMNVGKKFDQPLEQSYRLNFAWELVEDRAAYQRVMLSAETGPLSTRDYRITLEMVPLENGTTFMHLSYAYGFGFAGKLAMATYFSTVARDKVGFSLLGNGLDGAPIYVDGMRGQSERNTMRYYLAIESFLGAIATPQSARFEKTINDWFIASERYPRQLHELEQTDYLVMKRKEYLRKQRDEVAAAPG
jgi:hypothetical protein